MRVKLEFKDGGVEIVEEAHVVFNYGCLMLYVDEKDDPGNPNCDMYPLSNLKKIEIREGEDEENTRKKVVEMPRGQN